MHQTGNEKVEKATKEFQNRKTRSKTLEAWDRVQISRRNDRPVAGHYIEALFQDFIELHGDRYFSDDPAIVGGIAAFHGRAVTVIAQAKGQNTKENIGHNFGMPSPEMIENASKDIAQYKRYKEVLGDSMGSLVNFGQMKYNDSEQWEKLQSKFFAYLEINKKDWSEEFKSKSKQAYDRFREQGEELSVHALSRLPRLNKPGYEVIHEEDVLDLIKTMPNYSEGEEKMIWFSPSKQLVVIKNKNSGDIVSIVRRKNKKEEWTDAGL